MKTISFNTSCDPEIRRNAMLNPQTLTPGHEQHELFRAPGRMGKPGPECCQYDYRHLSGELFSCIAESLGEARDKRDEWLQARNVLMTDDADIKAREPGR
jgi:hypothetical protein